VVKLTTNAYQQLLITPVNELLIISLKNTWSHFLRNCIFEIPSEG